MAAESKTVDRPVPRPSRCDSTWRSSGRNLAFTALLIALATSTQAMSPTAGRLDVKARVRPGSCYVGQVVELTIEVTTREGRSTVETPRVVGADLVRLRDDKATQRDASGRDVQRTQFQLVPRRAGVLNIPPVSARSDDCRGTSLALTLKVRPVPAVGRPSTFLGGVGPFETTASAEPASVRAGQDFEYRITVRGPGARGVVSAPDLSRLERVPLGLRIERRPDLVVADPPSHVFRYQLHATRPGTATLPPVSISGFDPQTSRYQTRVAPGVPVQVADVPRFNPNVLDAGDPRIVPPRTRARSQVAVVAWSVVLASLAMGLGLSLIFVRRRRHRSRDLRRLLGHAVLTIERAKNGAAVGRAINEGLVAYLGRTVGRSAGALTMFEAERDVVRATGRDDLARRAAWLVHRADQAQFDDGAPPDIDLVGEGCSLLNDLAQYHDALGRAVGSRRRRRDEEDGRERKGKGSKR